MPNTLTNLIPDAYAALDVVSRELTGFIPSVRRDTAADQVAIGQTLRGQVTPRNTAGRNITAAMGFPAGAGQTIVNTTFTISKVRAFPFEWSGEEKYSADRGPGSITIMQDQIAQAIRAAVNEIETDIYALARVSASRAFGTAGTTPFGTNLGETAQMKKILDDNGAAFDERSLVIGTTAGASMRTLLNNPLNSNAALNQSVGSQGVLIDINQFKIRESAVIGSTTKGTGASYTTTAAGFAVGVTSIPLITGTGTILAGDTVTFAGDSNRYVVATGIAAPGTIVLAAPGLLQSISASATVVTVGNNYTPNVAFRSNALLLGTRLPALDGDDIANMREIITDPRTGLSFELAVYPGYRMSVFELGIAWGVSAPKPEHIGLLLG